MRKVAGLIAAAALLVPAGMFVAGPANAAPAKVPTCKAAAGSATFNPALPKLGNTSKVKGTLTAKGTLTKCTGGGVTKAATLFKSPKSKTGSNCQTLAQPDPKSAGTIGVFTITWGPGKTSTVAKLAIKQVAGKPTQATTKGKITKGLFLGKSVNGKIEYKLPAGACTAKPLSKVTYKNLGNFTIK